MRGRRQVDAPEGSTPKGQGGFTKRTHLRSIRSIGPGWWPDAGRSRGGYRAAGRHAQQELCVAPGELRNEPICGVFGESGRGGGRMPDGAGGVWGGRSARTTGVVRGTEGNYETNPFAEYSENRAGLVAGCRTEPVEYGAAGRHAQQELCVAPRELRNEPICGVFGVSRRHTRSVVRVPGS